MPPTVKSRLLSPSVIFVAALALAGCGVADYEKKMQEAEGRIQRVDEEDKLLGTPIVVPPLPKGPLVSVFLRPPKGISSTSRKDEFPFHYPAVTGVCSDMYIAIADGPGKVKKLIEDQFDVPAQNWQTVQIKPPGRAPLAFEAVQFVDPRAPAGAPAVYEVYVHQSVGVVFRILNANREAAKASVQMSMESYGAGRRG